MRIWTVRTRLLSGYVTCVKTVSSDTPVSCELEPQRRSTGAVGEARQITRTIILYHVGITHVVTIREKFDLIAQSTLKLSRNRVPTPNSAFTLAKLTTLSMESSESCIFYVAEVGCGGVKIDLSLTQSRRMHEIQWYSIIGFSIRTIVPDGCLRVCWLCTGSCIAWRVLNLLNVLISRQS